MPVPAFTATSVPSVVKPQNSPNANRFASLSMTTGRSKCCCSTARTGKLRQPGIREGSVTVPALTSTGPGRPTPTPSHSPGNSVRAASSCTMPANSASTFSGSLSMFIARSSTCRKLPPMSSAAMRTCREPKSAVQTYRSAG